MRRRPRPRSCWRAGRPHHRAGAGRRAVAPVGEPRREAGRRLHQDGCTAIVPPLLGSVAAEGEWALVSLDGAWSHAANKRIELPHAAAIEGLLAPEATAPHVADADQLAVGGAAVEHVVSRFGTPTSARVELVRGDDGTPSRLGRAHGLTGPRCWVDRNHSSAAGLLDPQEPMARVTGNHRHGDERAAKDHPRSRGR